MRKTALFAASLLATSLAQAAASVIVLPFYGMSVSGNGSIVTGLNSSLTAGMMWNVATGTSTSVGAWTQFQEAPVTNWDGSRIGGTVRNAQDNFFHAAYYTVATGQWTQLPGGLGATPINDVNQGGSYATLWAMSGNGNMLGGYGQVAGVGQGGNSLRAGIWNISTGTVSLLGTTNTTSRVDALSYDGRVASGKTGNSTPMVWTDFDGDGNYTGTNLRTATGKTIGEAYSMSTDGTWVAGLGLVGTEGSRSYRYNTVTNALDFLPLFHAEGSNWTSQAVDITADGKTIIGYEINNMTFERQGFIWREGIGTQSFDSYVASLETPGVGTFSFRVPSSISDDGNVITGRGTLPGTPDIGFLMTIPSAVPEPGSYALMLAGLGAVGFIARRRRVAGAAAA